MNGAVFIFLSYIFLSDSCFIVKILPKKQEPAGEFHGGKKLKNHRIACFVPVILVPPWLFITFLATSLSRSPDWNFHSLQRH